MKRNGILAFGNWIVDHIKNIETYPEKNLLTIIKSHEKSIGGGPANVTIDLAKMKFDFPLYAGGVVGDDPDGEYILESLKNNNIDSTYMRSTNKQATSYTDVMNAPKEHTRTFFHYLGSNSLLSFNDFDKVSNSSKICYLGYLLLLKGLEEHDTEYGNIGAKSLAHLQRKGFITVVDLVSNKDADTEFIKQCLKYVDYLIVNELEAEIITGIKIRKSDDSIDFDALKLASAELMKLGVNQQAIIHFPEGAMSEGSDGKTAWEASFKLNSNEILGTVGAGDAFCAGVLYGLHENLDIKTTLKIGNANAWFNLHNPTATDGAVEISKIMEFIKTAEQY